MAAKGEMGYPSVLSAPTWGFYDVLFKGKEFKFQRPYGSYVMEHVLFKIAFPAEFHAQTAAECAMALHRQVHERLGEIRKITIRTHQSAIRIIDKKGPLGNPADRDHCIQYMVAVPLILEGSPRATTRTRLPPIRASTPCARKWCASRTRVSAAITSTPTNARSPMQLRSSSGRQENRRSRRRISAWTPPPAQGRIPLLVEKFRDQPGAPLSGKATQCDPGVVPGSKRLEATPSTSLSICS
jgi:hypothetical protein